MADTYQSSVCSPIGAVIRPSVLRVRPFPRQRSNPGVRKIRRSRPFAPHVSLLVCLYFWGSAMNFPAEWGRPIGSRIDEWILWLTVNVSWLFDGIKAGITKVLVFIEDILIWIPWPVTILAVTLTAWKISGRTIAIFTAVALVLLGLMGRLPGGTATLWEGSMETLALIFRISNHILGIRHTPGCAGISQLPRRFHNEAHSRRNADHAQLRISDSRYYFLWPRQRTRRDGNCHLRRSRPSSV